jgi:hypothetical protein
MSKYSDMELSGDAPEACEDVSEVASPNPVQMSTDLTFPTNDVVSLVFCLTTASPRFLKWLIGKVVNHCPRLTLNFSQIPSKTFLLDVHACLLRI